MLPKDPNYVKEYRKKLSKAKKGKNNPMYGKTTWNKGVPAWNRGKPHSEETRKKISDAKKGRKWSKNEWKSQQKRIEKMKGSGNYFSHHKFIGEKNWNYGKKIPEWQKQIIRKARAKTIMPLKDTKPERMMQIALSLNGIKYEKHKLFINGKFFHRVDLFVEPNICIEVDGVYWHTKPDVMKRDIVVNHELQKLGNVVIRIWDKEILSNTQKCAEKIIHGIKQFQNSKLRGNY